MSIGIYTQRTALVLALSSLILCTNTWAMNQKLDIASKSPSEQLFYGVLDGNVELTKSAMALKANVNARDVKYNNTPLHYAATKGHAYIVSILLEAKARVEPINKEGKTPLHLAVEELQFTPTKILMYAGANHNRKTRTGLTIRDIATLSRYPSGMLAFIDKVASEINTPEFDRKTAIEKMFTRPIRRQVELSPSLKMENNDNKDNEAAQPQESACEPQIEALHQEIHQTCSEIVTTLDDMICMIGRYMQKELDEIQKPKLSERVESGMSDCNIVSNPFLDARVAREKAAFSSEEPGAANVEEVE